MEAAWKQWAELDDPPWHEFGLTATPTGHRVWYREPDGPTWDLSIP